MFNIKPDKTIANCFLYKYKYPIGLIVLGVLCIIIGNLPYAGNINLRAKTISTAVSIDLSTKLVLNDKILLNTKRLVIDEVDYSENHFVEQSYLALKKNSKPSKGKLTVIAGESSKIYLSGFQVPEKRNIHFFTNNENVLEMNVRSLSIDEPVSLRGKLALQGSGQVCFWNDGKQQYCKDIKAREKFPGYLKVIYFVVNSADFSIKLPIKENIDFERTQVSKISYGKYEVQNSYNKSSYSCSLIDGELVFTKQETARDLWFVDCPKFWGGNLDLSLNWSGKKIKARINGFSITNKKLMPSIIQGTLGYPELSDAATLMGWIVSVLSTFYLFIKPQKEV